tara:strand:+ start:74 stop:457 length:384 start_codon:yes stop_codon:yes gene_type:complete
MKHLLAISSLLLFLTACDINSEEDLKYMTCYESDTGYLEFNAVIDKNTSEEFPLGRVLIDENYTMKIAILTDYDMVAELNNGRDGIATQVFKLHRYTGWGSFQYFDYEGKNPSFRQSVTCEKMEKLF